MYGISGISSEKGAVENGLVAYWNFDEGKGTIVKDISGNENNGEVFGAKWVKGVKGFALQFDGIDDFVVVESNKLLEITDKSFSFEAWVKPYSLAPKTSPPGPRGIIIRPGYHMGLMYGSTGQFTFSFVNSSNIFFSATSKAAYACGNWYHIVGVFDYSVMKLFIYVNGELVGDGNFSGTPKNYRTPYYIGCADPKNINYPFWFHGEIDEVKIYNRALTQEEVQKLYNSIKIVE